MVLITEYSVVLMQEIHFDLDDENFTCIVCKQNHYEIMINFGHTLKKRSKIY